MRLFVAALTSLVAISLAAAQSPKDGAKGDAKPATSTDPKRVKTIPLDAAGEPKAKEPAKEQTKEQAKEPAKGKQAAKSKSGKGVAKGEKTEKAEKAEKAEKVSKEVADSYNAIPLAERVAIQNDLIWAGDYNGVLNGEFGARAVAAVKAFQKR